MPTNAEHIDPEKGPGGLAIPSGMKEELGEEPCSTLKGHSDADSEVGTTGNSSTEGLSRAGTQKERKDFDDGANPLWSLYGTVAKTHDQARFSSLAEDMEGVLLFAGLFSGVLASFLVQSIPNLQVNPADQSVYYQNQSVYYQQQSAYYQQQSVAMLAEISQQLASIAPQVSISSIAPPISTPITVPPSSASSAVQQASIPSISPPPYPAFKPSFSDVRVNAFWLVSLVCALSAALLAILIKQWVRRYMQVFERYDHPLKRARFRQFFFEGAHGMRNLAEAIPRLIHLSLCLFFVGLGDSMLNTNTAAGITTIIPICLCGTIYLYSTLAHLRDLQSPYKTLISRPIFFLMQKFPRSYFGARFLHRRRTPTTFEAYQEELVMEDTRKRKGRDVRAVRWLVDNIAATGEVEPLVLAIPGTFNTEWGREVWIDVSSQGPSDPDPWGSPNYRPAKEPLLLPSADARRDVGACVLSSRPRHHWYAVSIFDWNGLEKLASWSAK
ncbi:hypothetical protein EI94DRAFT_640160 [Lactarius quietus]|nr:hypothetical protein EI94DRAFT_640160 [Lactarius quietus]